MKIIRHSGLRGDRAVSIYTIITIVIISTRNDKNQSKKRKMTDVTDELFIIILPIPIFSDSYRKSMMGASLISDVSGRYRLSNIMEKS